MADCFLPYRSRLQLNTRFPFLYRWPLLNLWVATHTAWSGTVMIWVYAGFILVHSVPSLSFMKWAQYENRKTPQDDSSMPLTSVQLLGVDFSLFLQVHTTATEGPGHQLFFFSSRTPPSSRLLLLACPSWKIYTKEEAKVSMDNYYRLWAHPKYHHKWLTIGNNNYQTPLPLWLLFLSVHLSFTGFISIFHPL